jgi:hypothetical protein
MGAVRKAVEGNPVDATTRYHTDPKELWQVRECAKCGLKEIRKA